MAEPDLSKIRCLIVEGNHVFSEWAQDVLRRAGVGAVAGCATPGEAAVLVREFLPTVVLVDLDLPRMAGIELIRLLRDKKANPNPDVYVIPMATAASPDMLRRAVQLGIVSFIRKPLDEPTFIRRVAIAEGTRRRFVFGRRYFGPDRRRMQMAFDGAERRRGVAAAASGPAARARTPDAPEPETPVNAMGDESDAQRARDTQAAELDAVMDPGDARSAENASVPHEPSADEREAEGRPEKDNEQSTTTARSANGKANGRARNAGEPAEQTAKVAAVARADKDRKSGPRPNGRSRHPGNGQFSKLVDQHLLWLRTGGKEGVRANLAKADLHGIDISGINFTSADLREAVLSDSLCRKTIFQGADLRWADMAHADISEGDLGVARLRHTNFRNTLMSGANLRGADLAGADLSGADLKGVDLSGANLLSANFSNADLSEVVGLTQAQFDKALADQKTRLPGGIRLPQGE